MKSPPLLTASIPAEVLAPVSGEASAIVYEELLRCLYIPDKSLKCTGVLHRCMAE